MPKAQPRTEWSLCMHLLVKSAHNEAFCLGVHPPGRLGARAVVAGAEWVSLVLASKAAKIADSSEFLTLDAAGGR